MGCKLLSMVKTTGVQPGQVRPQGDGAKSLNAKEQQSAKQKQAGRISSSDAARLASQAGFQRLGPKKQTKFNVGDGSSQQFALPEDDVDPDSWSQEGLESAQGELTLAGAQFGELAKSMEAETTLGAAVIGSSFLPTDEDLDEMDVLARRPPPPTPMLDEVSNSVSKLFGIELDDEVPIGHKLLAAGLVVAGETAAVQVDTEKRTLREQELAGGLEKVTRRGHQAVSEAQNMNKGVSEKLNLQRTFMYRR